MLPFRRNPAKSASGSRHSQSPTSFSRPSSANAPTSSSACALGIPAASRRRCRVSGARVCAVQLIANHRSNAPPWYVHPLW